MREEAITPTLIPMRLMKQIGLFRKDVGAFTVPTSQGHLDVLYDSLSNIVTLSMDEEGKNVNIIVKVAFKNLKFGQRPYFICPAASTFCNNLIISGGEVFSRGAFLAAPSRLSKRSRREQIKVAQAVARHWVSQVTGSKGGDYQSESPFDSEMRRRRDESIRRRARWQMRELGTVKALDCGRGAGQFTAYEQYIEKPPEHHIAATPDRITVAPVSPRLLDEFPSLDIRVIASRFGFEEGKARAKTLGWPTWATNDFMLLMIMDLREMATPMIMISTISRDGDEPGWQRIELTKTRSGRWYFLCPAEQKPCEILYLRDGVFASREAQRLYHPSQRLYGQG